MKSYDVVSEKYSAFEPSLPCGLAGGLLGSLGLKDCSFLVHGSSGCGFAMRYGLSQHWKSFIPCPVTSLHERDVIFGGTSLLKKGIEQIEKIHTSEILFILTSCSSEIIGDDLEEVALEETEKRNKKVVAVEVGGATGNIFDGYNDFIYKLIKDFQERFLDNEEPCPGDAAGGQPKQVDIMGIIPLYDMFFRGDMAELRRMLHRLGIHVNSFLSGDCSVESMKRMFQSDLVVSISSRIGYKAMQKLKRVSGLSTHQFRIAPIGFEYTMKFLREIAELLGIDADTTSKVLEEEETIARKKMLRGFDFSKVMFTSGRAAIIGEPSRTIALTNFLLNELGMRSTMIAFTSKVNDEELEELDRVLKLRNNRAKVLIGEDNYLIRKCLLESSPNIVFGRSIDRLKELDKTAYITWQFPSTNRLIIYDKPYLGFNGVVSIVDDIVNGFSNIWY